MEYINRMEYGNRIMRNGNFKADKARGGRYALSGYKTAESVIAKEGIELREGELMEARNVRRDRQRGEVWRSAPLPAKLRDEGWLPLESIYIGEGSGGDGNLLLLHRGEFLGVVKFGKESISEALASGEVATLGKLSAEPIGAERVGSDLLRIYLRHAPAEYVAIDSGGLTLLGRMPRMPEVSFGIAATTRLSEPFGWVKLSGSGVISGSRLRRSDITLITEKALEGYGRMLADAHERGYFVQPVLVRVRFVDMAGATIETGPPVAMCYGGFQCCEPITALSADSLATLSGGAWSATGWAMKATLSGGVAPAWRRRIGAMIVEALEDFDIIRSGAQSHTSAQQTGSGYEVSLWLPGVADTASANNLRQKAIVTEGLRRSAGSKTLWREHLCIALPFDSDKREFTVSYSNTPARPAPCGRSERRDSVSYGTIYRQPGIFAGGSLTVERSEGFGLRQFAVADDTAATGAWEALAVATIAGRQTPACRHTLASGARTAALSPVLVFPDERATSLSLYLKAGTSVKSITLTLTPLPGCGMAVWIADNILPLTLTAAENGAIPEVSPAGGCDRSPSAVEIATDQVPGTIGNRIIDASAGETVAICQAPRANSSWDFSRLRLLLAATDGVRLLTLGSEGAIHSLTLLDSRPVPSADCIACVPGKRGTEVIALAGGDLLRYSSRGSEMLLAEATSGEPDDSIGYERHFNEIWLSGAAGIQRLAAREGYSERVAVTGLPEGSVKFCQSGGELLMTIEGSGLYGCGTAGEEPAETLLRRRHPLDRLLGACELRCFASSAEGRIALKGDNGTRIPGTLAGIEVSGALNTPIRLRLIAPLRHWIEEDYRLTLPADGEIHPARIFGFLRSGERGKRL